METINNILSKVLYNNHGVEVTVGTILILVLTLLITHLLLRFTRVIASRRLDEDDKNRFKTVFTFLKYIIFSVVIVTTLDASGVKITAILAASTALFVGIGLGMQKLFQEVY